MIVAGMLCCVLLFPCFVDSDFVFGFIWFVFCFGVLVWTAWFCFLWLRLFVV